MNDLFTFCSYIVDSQPPAWLLVMQRGGTWREYFYYYYYYFYISFKLISYYNNILFKYLDFDNLPETNFSCQGKVIGGYYADVEVGCQMFHVCTIGQKGNSAKGEKKKKEKGDLIEPIPNQINSSSACFLLRIEKEKKKFFLINVKTINHSKILGRLDTIIKLTVKEQAS